jgi:hypothetical protein
MKASLPSQLKVTLYASLTAGIVVITLSVVGLKTCTLADFMFVTQRSAAQLALAPTPAIAIASNDNAALISFTRRICCSSFQMAQSLHDRDLPLTVA